MANEAAVRRAIKTLINDNGTTLVQDIYQDGIQKQIEQITTSVLTAPSSYFFIAISTTDVRDKVRTGFENSNASIPPSEAEYDLVIEVTNVATSSSEDDQMYENVDSDFQTLGDRIVSLIRSTRWITDSVTSQKYRLVGNERLINKTNLTSIFTEGSQYYSMLYSRISFTLLEECTDDTELY